MWWSRWSWSLRWERTGWWFHLVTGDGRMLHRSQCQDHPDWLNSSRQYQPCSELTFVQSWPGSHWWRTGSPLHWCWVTPSLSMCYINSPPLKSQLQIHWLLLLIIISCPDCQTYLLPRSQDQYILKPVHDHHQTQLHYQTIFRRWASEEKVVAMNSCVSAKASSFLSFQTSIENQSPS